jgi:ABC-type Fe3+/spermidine/putrescine transport system ATPase subunit
MSGNRMIRIEHLNIRLGEFNLRDIDLQIDEGEYFVLLGPTGAGKSVLLECIAGIYRQDSGAVFINGRDVTRLYPEERNVGYVPQDYALFPNMTVQRNLEYGLKVRKMAAPDIRAKAAAMMDQLGIGHLENRLPLNLSGGEKQRVALGRALITRPGILLLDEPLSALDENLRAQLAEELAKIQRNSNRTFLHVCHSFDEASMVADRIAVMRQGVIEQAGTIRELLAKPSSRFIAEFTRMRNFHEGIAEAAGGGCRIRTASGAVVISDAAGITGPVTFGIRPEEIALLHDNTDADGVNHLNARVVQVRFRPLFLEVELDAGFSLIVYQRMNDDFSRRIAGGDRLRIHIRPEAVVVFPKNRESSGGSAYIPFAQKKRITIRIR